MIVITRNKDGTYVVSNGTILRPNLGLHEAISVAHWQYKLDKTKVRVALIAMKLKGDDMLLINEYTFETRKIDYTNQTF